MHIIFGKEQADKLDEKYTVLELDQFRLGPTGPVITAFCAVEKIPFTEMDRLIEDRALHASLLTNYQQRNWQACADHIAQLKGRWSGELDSFYDDLHQRAQVYIQNPPPADWTPIIQK